jgi:hypothetical protein
MTRVRLYLVGSLVLIALAGCGRSLFDYVQREAWRHEAEVACLKSGSVKENPALVRIEPIDGPGVCGADFPLKVAALGTSGVLGFADDPRPPAPIPGGRNAAQQPRWPVREQVLQWRTPSGSEAEAPAADTEPGAAPLSIHPPGIPAPEEDAAADGPEVDRPEVANENAPRPVFPRTLSGPSVPLGPQRGQRLTASIGPIAVKPAATLACPIVSALDQWIVSAVQPAATRWFGQPVVAIKQISAYSCRGMNGNPRARISEHAFGNALDIAAFTLADGRTVTVKRGWRGAPEEQGFLRDVQAAACQTFTTVLAPGSNRFHYDHMHVDLMRRRSGRIICQPGAVSGEIVAARAARGKYTRHGDPAITGSITSYAGKSDEGGVSDDDWVEHDGPRERVE